MASLVDTNVLACRFHGRFPEKQRVATELLRAGAAEGKVYLPHQAIPDHGARHHRLITAPREVCWVQLEGPGTRVVRIGAVPHLQTGIGPDRRKLPADAYMAMARRGWRAQPTRPALRRRSLPPWPMVLGDSPIPACSAQSGSDGRDTRLERQQQEALVVGDECLQWLAGDGDNVLGGCQVDGIQRPQIRIGIPRGSSDH